MSSPQLLTPRQLEILMAVVSDMKVAEVDWDTVAQKANCKTGKYARDQFNALRKQLHAASSEINGGGDGGASTPKPKSAKKATPANKRKKDDADGEEDKETPSKKPKKAPVRKSKSATPAATKETTPKATIPAEENGDAEGEAVVKTEPNEAGELMDDIEGGNSVQT